MFKVIDENRATKIIEAIGLKRAKDDAYFAYDDQNKVIVSFETKEQRDNFCRHGWQGC